MNRRGLWKHGIEFPLNRLYALISNGIWSDADSEHMWTGAGLTRRSFAGAYQLWDRNPTDGAKFLLQDVEMTCPWCLQTKFFPLNDFTQCHVAKTRICRCGSCGREFNADSLSAKYFIEDLREFLRLHNPWFIPD